MDTHWARGMMMEDGSTFRKLFRNTLVALLCCAALILLCYLFVDRPVAFYVHDQRFADYPVLKWLTYPPDILEALVPVALAVLMVRRIRGPFNRWERVVLATCLAVILAEQFKDAFAYLFGRYWPETWIDNNPSLIHDGAYGFHPFHRGDSYRSFPSGHTARIVAAASVMWIAYPRWRWAWVLLSMAVISGLILMDYHFVGDVVAGGFIGAIVGTYLIHCINAGKTDAPVSNSVKPVE
jgi:membrane-associated phospholipid phosphatase